MTTEPLMVCPIGCKVLVGDEITATVLSITIRDDDNVQYLVSWWDNNTRHDKWVEACEISSLRAEIGKLVGFNDTTMNIWSVGESKVRAALGAYHQGLTDRKNGNTLAGHFVDECERILDMDWDQSNN